MTGFGKLLICRARFTYQTREEAFMAQNNSGLAKRSEKGLLTADVVAIIDLQPQMRCRSSDRQTAR
jgi:hypothetical protein